MSEFQKNHPRRVLFHGHIEAGVEDILDMDVPENADLEEVEVKNCEYYGICPLHKYSMKCVFNSKKCRSFQYFKKYKEFDFGRQLGI